ncbi:MAG TPA: hypothetical protein VNA25_10715 [Phycisphaerae bacterium]|nr:hypothetical protein [Phycisphaerae bacterium]
MDNVIDRLLKSEEPSVRYKVRVGVLGEAPQSRAVRRLQGQIRRSPRVRSLLSERTADGRTPRGAYSKWDGAHWLLAMLADIGYPPGDVSLIPLRDQVCQTWLSAGHLKKVRTIDGRTRRCGSQEGNAVWSILTLGLADERVDQLVENLLRWQWPDGGWNCDKRPAAINSSFHETLIPLRAMALYGRLTGRRRALAAAKRAADVFLKRRLFRRQRDGAVMDPSFLKLHYPPYWHYDLLFGLKVLAEAGFIRDRRCREGLDVLQSKRLPDGGWPAEARYYYLGARNGSGRSLVAWGGANRRCMNEWVTADALFVLRQARRLP